MKTCILVSIKTNNKRLPGKTFKMLGGKPLYSYLFRMLKEQSKAEVYIDSSDEEVLKISNEWGFKTIKRPEEYNSDSTSGDELLGRVVDMVDFEVIGALYITSPFISKETIERAINEIENNESIDSLLGVVPRYNRFWYNNKPVNHNINHLIRTQDLTPVYEEADFYFVRKSSFKRYGKRVCGNIKTQEVNVVEATDIDTAEDFVYAESLLNGGFVKDN